MIRYTALSLAQLLCLRHHLAVLVVACAFFSVPASAQIGMDGEVVEVSNPLRIRLVDGVRAPLGTIAHAFRTIRGNGGDVGVLTGTYRVVSQQGRDAFAEPTLMDNAVQGASIGNSVELYLNEEASTLGLTTEPSGATVLWNGHDVGQTPVRLAVVAGTVSLTLRLTGYETLSVDLPIRAGVIQDETITLSEALTAEFHYQTAERAWYARQWEAASIAAERAISSRDGSLTDVQRESLPGLAFAASLGARLRMRLEISRLSDDAFVDIVSKTRLIHDNRLNAQKIETAIEELKRLLAGDTALDEVLALLPTPLAPAVAQ